MTGLRNLFEGASILGLSRLLKTKNKYIKLVWIVSLLVLIGMVAVFFYDAIVTYFNYDVITHVDIFAESNAEFPTVSFCISYFRNSDTIEFSLNKSLKYCRFETFPCNWTDFEIYSNNYEELCFRFNSGKDFYNNRKPIRTTSYADHSYGLSVFFDLKGLKYDIYHNLTPYKLNAYIQNSSSLFRRNFNYDSGLLVPAGLTYIKVQRQFINKLSEPYNNCVKQNTNKYVSYLFQYFIQNNLTYSQRDCLNLCYGNISLQKCNCTASLNSDSADCLNRSDIKNCFISKYENSSNACLKLCPNECDSVNYQIDQVYFGTFPNEYLDKTNLTYITNENRVFISVYYPSLEYILFREIPKNKPFDLFSTIAGLLSLFVGISLISLVEIIEIFIEIVLNTQVKIFLKK